MNTFHKDRPHTQVIHSGGSGAPALNQTVYPSEVAEGSISVEVKTCEVCGKPFTRRVPESAKLGQKICPACLHNELLRVMAAKKAQMFARVQ